MNSFLLAFAIQLCWQNPTENVDGTLVSGLQEIRVYKDNAYFATWAPNSSCVNFRIAEGTYNFNITAVDIDGDESSFSNTVRKTESRLGGPSGGNVLRGPSGGTVITE